MEIFSQNAGFRMRHCVLALLKTLPLIGLKIISFLILSINLLKNIKHFSGFYYLPINLGAH